MNKISYFFLLTTSIVPFIGLNLNAARAQNIYDEFSIDRAPSRISIVPIDSRFIIAQSRRKYTCNRLPDGGTRLEPNIPGSIVRGSTCYVPVKAGKCVAAKGYWTIPSGPSDWGECRTQVGVIKDKFTGETYYEFKADPESMEFILEN